MVSLSFALHAIFLFAIALINPGIPYLALVLVLFEVAPSVVIIACLVVSRQSTGASRQSSSTHSSVPQTPRGGLSGKSDRSAPATPRQQGLQIELAKPKGSAREGGVVSGFDSGYVRERRGCLDAKPKASLGRRIGPVLHDAGSDQGEVDSADWKVRGDVSGGVDNVRKETEKEEITETRKKT